MESLILDEARLVEFAKSVDLLASQVLEGLHRSSRGGEGLEFHSAVPYSQGDDVRRVDWKRFAAQDRLYIRRYDREERSAWQIAFDRSESMKFGEKAWVARQWVGAQQILCQVWGDRLSVMGAESEESLTYESLWRDDSGFDFRDWQSLSPLPQSQVVFLSDFFFPLGGLEAWIREAKESVKSISLVQILDPREASFDYKDVYRFEDFESRSRLTLDAQSIKSAYLGELSHLQESLRRFVGDDFFRVFVVGQSSLEKELMAFIENLEGASQAL